MVNKEEQKDPMSFIGPQLPENGIYRNMKCELIRLKKDMGITSKKIVKKCKK